MTILNEPPIEHFVPQPPPVPQRQPRWVQVPGDYAFHTLSRAWMGSRWWRPLLSVVLAAAYYLVLVVMITAPILVVQLVREEITGVPAVEWWNFEDTSTIGGLSTVMLMLALFIPAGFLATLTARTMPLGFLLSVAGRMRWHWLGVCLLVAAAVNGAQFVLHLSISMASGEQITWSVPPAFPLYLLLVAVLVPLQCFAEELAFRGMLPQLLGAWVRNPLVAYLLPAPLFMLGHPYGVVGSIEVTVFAIVMGWVTWRTGGLEAATVMHALGNITIIVGEAVGFYTSTPIVDEAGWPDTSFLSTGISVAFMLLFCLGVEIAQRQFGITRTLRVPPAEPVASGTFAPLPTAGR